MSKIYVRLDVVAHMIALQQIKEGQHREKIYATRPELKQTVRLEQSSALYHAFCKILDAARMSHNISEHDIKQLKVMTYSCEYAEKNISSWILKTE